MPAARSHLPPTCSARNSARANAVSLKKVRFHDALRLLGPLAELKPEGYAVDRQYPDIFYVPEDAEFSVREGSVRWKCDEAERRLALRADDHLRPSQRISPADGEAIRRIGVEAGGRAASRHAVPQTCTVSGGGKSEISKSIGNVILEGPVFVGDLSPRHRASGRNPEQGFLRESTRIALPTSDSRRPILSPERTHGLGDSALYAFAGIYGRAQRLAAHACPTPFANCCSP